MKTLFLYDRCGDDAPTFFVLEGDYQHLDGIYGNSSEDQQKVKELSCILQQDDLIFFSAPTKDWDYFVLVGWFS